MRVEGIITRVVQHVGQAGGVDVSKASQATEEVGWVVVGSEQASKARVEQGLGKRSAKRNTKQIPHSVNQVSFISN